MLESWIGLYSEMLIMRLVRGSRQPLEVIAPYTATSHRRGFSRSDHRFTKWPCLSPRYVPLAWIPWMRFFTLEESRARLLDSLFETPLGDWGELGVTCFPLLENGRDENLGKIR